MTLSKKIIIGVLSLAVFWHILVGMTHRIKLAGLFLTKPSDPGYVWEDAANTDPRFFWQNISVKWETGVKHPEFAVETSETEGHWNLMPGYTFVDKATSLETKWQASLLHPDYMAWSDDVEGMWIPVTGYRFVYEGGTFVDSVWDPGKRYDDLKVISLTEKDQYRPFPGYKFIEPGKSLKVNWVPGSVNWENRSLIAGASEGSWKVNAQPSYRSSRSDNEAAAVFLGRVLYHAL
ncbi:hypothetical protein [Spirosoma gilvum]